MQHADATTLRAYKTVGEDLLKDASRASDARRADLRRFSKELDAALAKKYGRRAQPPNPMMAPRRLRREETISHDSRRAPWTRTRRDGRVSLRDQLDCIPVYVVWEITLACNLKCLHCGSRAGHRRARELDTAECIEVIRQLAERGTREHLDPPARRRSCAATGWTIGLRDPRPRHRLHDADRRL